MSHGWVIVAAAIEAFWASVGAGAVAALMFNIHWHRWERVAMWEDKVWGDAVTHYSVIRIKAKCVFCDKQRVVPLERWPYLRLSVVARDELEKIMRSSK